MQAAPVSSEAAGTTGQGGGPSTNLINILFPFIIIFAIMYIFLIMPQKRKDKQHRAMLSQLNKNDRVVTAGGIHAFVMSVKEGTVVLKIDDDKDVKITVNVGSIAQVIPKGEKESE